MRKPTREPDIHELEASTRYRWRTLSREYGIDRRTAEVWFRECWDDDLHALAGGTDEEIRDLLELMILRDTYVKPGRSYAWDHARKMWRLLTTHGDSTVILGYMFYDRTNHTHGFQA